MVWTVIQVSLRRLSHNRVELLLTFVVPIAFFSVFALIFGKGIGSGSTPKVRVVMVDTIDSEETQAIATELRENAGLRWMDDVDDQSLSTEEAAERVRSGTVTIGIVLKQNTSGDLEAELLADASDQVAGQVVSALVGRELVLSRVRSASKPNQNVGTDDQILLRRPDLDTEPSTINSVADIAPPTDSMNATSAGEAMDAVSVTDVMGAGKTNPVVSMYAAGIAVMFLLFGATGGGGVLLEERENTTLDRLLSTQLTMDQLLLGKWFYLSGLGFVQVCVMFLWGQFVFGVDLLGHVDGFIMMTIVTSGAAAAFGLFLATLCKTRGQLNGLSVILILTMSALGGSMVPRYVMSDRMREMGLWTFNAWALDGYNKVFWRDLPVEALGPQLAVLMVAGLGFLLTARILAIRWESD
ncbi:MAG: ABC transporter permease [Planctomycetota bacterium]